MWGMEVMVRTMGEKKGNVETWYVMMPITD